MVCVFRIQLHFWILIISTAFALSALYVGQTVRSTIGNGQWRPKALDYARFRWETTDLKLVGYSTMCILYVIRENLHLQPAYSSNLFALFNHPIHSFYIHPVLCSKSLGGWNLVLLNWTNIGWKSHYSCQPTNVWWSTHSGWKSI